MKIVSIDESMLTGIIQISKFELGIFKIALANLEKIIDEIDYEHILGATVIEVEKLRKEILKFCSIISKLCNKDSKYKLKSCMEVISFDMYRECIYLRLGYLESAAFFESLHHLFYPIDESDCCTLTGLELSEMLQVNEKLKEILAKIT